MNMTKISAMALDEYTKEQLLAQFPDIKDWDGVYHDSELTGLDSGYPPGSDGAHAWEKLNPGKKVVDVLFRDETDPEWSGNEKAVDGSQLNEKNQKILSDYKAEIDSINKELMGKYDAKSNILTPNGINPMLPDDILVKCGEEAIDRYEEVRNRYNGMCDNKQDGIEMLMMGIE